MNRFNYPNNYPSPYGGLPQTNDRFQPQLSNRSNTQESFPYGRGNAPYDPRMNKPSGTYSYQNEPVYRKVTPPVKKDEEDSISVSESDDDDDDNEKGKIDLISVA